MRELEFIEIIKTTLSKNSYIGDDCAYLKDLGIVITQDSLVEEIHFSRKYSTPYNLGYKAIIVNLSDIFASGAIPKYITISLSLPKDIDNEFVSEFYRACDDLSKEFDFEVVGGDITGSEKIFISVCAIGLTSGRKISSRSHAKIGDYVITTGNHGSSAVELFLLMNEGEKGKGKRENKTDLNNFHLHPKIKNEFSVEIATKMDRDYAMMDTSDGLIDALFKIAQSSNVLISVDFDKIPYDKGIEIVANQANADFRDWIFYGGEDYQLVACVDEENLKKLDKTTYTIIGQVKNQVKDHFVEVVYKDKIQQITNLDKTFNHFKYDKRI